MTNLADTKSRLDIFAPNVASNSAFAKFQIVFKGTLTQDADGATIESGIVDVGGQRLFYRGSVSFQDTF